MGVLMQAFYWDCPRKENREYQWWELVTGHLIDLRSAGFTALWLPPASKAPNITGPSMGYDPYDYYDLGDIDQKGRRETWFGSRRALEQLIAEAHRLGFQVYADLVFNHNSGADEEEVNPIDGRRRWTRFRPGSGKFPRDWKCFHPSPYERYDNETFGDMPDLCHRNPAVYSEILDYARWLVETIGFDGFRYDLAKGYGSWLVTAIQEYRYENKGEGWKLFGVGECWAEERTIENWLNETNAWSDNDVHAFDFALRYRLREMCDAYGFSLKKLTEGGVLARDNPSLAVTFVENHDVFTPGRERHDPIANDKMLAYAYILTHEGYPCVFWYDYFNLGLGLPGTPNGIEALVRAHETNAGGRTTVLHVDDDLYVMQREGQAGQAGLVFVLNNRGDRWNGATVRTRWLDASFVPVAWRGRDDLGIPDRKRTDLSGYGEFWAPPRGYVVYVPSR